MDISLCQVFSENKSRKIVLDKAGVIGYTCKQ